MIETYELNTRAWSEWVEYRSREKRIKIGPIAQRKQVEMLCRYDPATQQQIIDTSIMNSWQGLFPPKWGSNGHGSGQTGHTQDTRRLAPHERVRAAAERAARERQG